MKIRWIGHACFQVTTADGTRILTDPFDESVGYQVPSSSPDIVTVSHHHFDHDAVRLLPGKPTVVDRSGRHNVRGIPIKGIGTFHDEAGGTKRGPNIVFVLEIDGLKLCHLGDLGHRLSPAQVKEIGAVDVLLVPVGGTYTIDAPEAVAVVEQLRPRLVIPMHFKTPALSFPIEPVDRFVREIGGAERPQTTTLDLTAADLEEKRRVVVLNYM